MCELLLEVEGLVVRPGVDDDGIVEGGHEWVHLGKPISMSVSLLLLSIVTYIDGGRFATRSGLLCGRRPFGYFRRKEVIFSGGGHLDGQREEGLVHALRLSVVLVARLVPAEVVCLAAVSDQLDADEGVSEVGKGFWVRLV